MKKNATKKRAKNPAMYSAKVKLDLALTPAEASALVDAMMLDDEEMVYIKENSDEAVFLACQKLRILALAK